MAYFNTRSDNFSDFYVHGTPYATPEDSRTVPTLDVRVAHVAMYVFHQYPPAATAYASAYTTATTAGYDHTYAAAYANAAAAAAHDNAYAAAYDAAYTTATTAGYDHTYAAAAATAAATAASYGLPPGFGGTLAPAYPYPAVPAAASHGLPPSFVGAPAPAYPYPAATAAASYGLPPRLVGAPPTIGSVEAPASAATSTEITAYVVSDNPQENPSAAAASTVATDRLVSEGSASASSAFDDLGLERPPLVFGDAAFSLYTEISMADNFEDLLSVMERYRGSLDKENITAAWTKLKGLSERGHSNTGCINFLINSTIQKFGQFHPSDIGIITEVLLKLENTSEVKKLSEKVIEKILANRPPFAPDIFKAYTLSLHTDSNFGHDHLYRNMQSFSPEQLSFIATTLCEKQTRKEVWQSIKESSLRQIHSFNSYQLAVLCNSFAKAKMKSDTLFNAIARRVNIDELSTKDLSTIAHAFSSLHVTSSDLLLRTGNNVSTVHVIDSYETLRDYSTITWSLAILYTSDPLNEEYKNTVFSLFYKIENYLNDRRTTLQSPEATQLNQARLAFGIRLEIFPYIKTFINRHIQSQRITQPSQSQQNLFEKIKTFLERTLPFDLEGSMIQEHNESGLSIDMVFLSHLHQIKLDELEEQRRKLENELKPEEDGFCLTPREHRKKTHELEQTEQKILFLSKKLAIEFDGPCHLGTNIDREGDFILGKNYLRDHIIKSQGWKMLRFSHKETDGKRDHEIEDLLKQKMRQAQ